MTKYFKILNVLTILSILHSCNSQNKSIDFQKPQLEVERVSSWISNQWPKTNKLYKTTNSQIYLNNINSSIQVFKRLYKSTKNPIYATQLANKYYFRYRVIGDFEDATTALNLIKSITNEYTNNDDILITYATILSGFHDFNKALVLLNKINIKSKYYKNAQSLKDEILFARGRYKNYQSVINSDKELNTEKAQYALLNNDFERASGYYKIEMDKYNDTDPYQLAWLQLQQGIAFLRYGELHSAKVFFQAAHERFPEFYLATEHLAETQLRLKNFESARDLYQQVSNQTNNPEFTAQLALAQKHLKQSKLSQANLYKAEHRFDELIKQYPKAIGDHAIDFFMDINKPQKALKLAQYNLNNRQNIESYIQLIKTALANKKIELSCKNLYKSLGIGYIPIELLHLTESLKNRCSLN